MLNLIANYVSLKAKAGKSLRELRALDAGATAIEYGLIAALIAVVVVGAVTAIGTSLNTGFNSVSAGLR